jgi:hypothetical protein
MSWKTFCLVSCDFTRVMDIKVMVRVNGKYMMLLL